MRPNRPLQVGLLLALATLLLVPLNIWGTPRPAPHSVSFLAWLRLIVGLPVVLLVPAYFLVPFLAGTDLRARQTANSDALSRTWVLLTAVGLNIVIHFVHFNAFRFLDIPIRWGPLLAIAIVEIAICLTLWGRRLAALEFATPPRSSQAAVAVGVVVVLLFGAWKSAHLTRDSSWYFDNDILNQGWEASEEVGFIALEWADGRPFVQGSSFQPQDLSETLRILNESDRPQQVPVYFLVHGKVGCAAVIAQHDLTDMTSGMSPSSRLGTPVVIEQAPDLPYHGQVERYWEWGAALVADVVQVPPKGRAEVDIRVLPDPSSPEPPRLEDFEILGLANLAGGEVRGELEVLGIHSMHPFQMLNVTENVRWAAEVASTHVLPGHSPPWADPPSTLHQPPVWTYLYAPARELLSPQLVSASMLLMLILFGIVLVGIQAMESQNRALPVSVGASLALALALNAAQHGRLMVSDGSMNFPDNLFALGIFISVVALCTNRQRIFVLWAVLTALLRYPGVAVIGFAGASLMLLDAKRRIQTTEAMVKLGLAIGLFCGVMLGVGGLLGLLPTWLYALYFETIPEHFHNPGEGADPLFKRPVVFFRMWMICGGGALLFAWPFRNQMSRVMSITALLYFPCLAFIHHYSHHYFLPLIGLAVLAPVASIASREPGATQRRMAVALACVCGALFWWANRLSI